MHRIPAMTVILSLMSLTLMAAQKPGEPAYSGKPASDWAVELSRGQRSLHMWVDQPKDAFSAFREMGAAAVPELVQRLKDKDRMVRHNTAEALKHMGPEARAGLPQLVAALDDEDADVRGLACDAIGSMGIEAYSAIPRLQRLLSDTRNEFVPPHGTWAVRDRARDALVAIRVGTLPGFIKCAEFNTTETRMVAIQALGQFPEEAAMVVPMLIKKLEDPEPVVRSVAASSLHKLGPLAKLAAGPLAKHLDDAGQHGIGVIYSGNVEYASALALERVGPTIQELPPILKRMQLILKEQKGVRSREASRDYVQDVSVKLVGRIGPDAKSAIPALEVELKKSSETAAASILLIDPTHQPAQRVFFSSIGISSDDFLFADTIRRLDWKDQKSIDALKKILSHKRGDRTFTAAAGILLRINPELDEARQAFQKGMSDFSNGIRISYQAIDDEWDAILSILEEVPAAARIVFPIAIENWSNEYRHDGAKEALHAMRRHGDLVVPELLVMLTDPASNVRVTAAEILATLGPSTGKSAPQVVKALGDARPAVRAAAAKALGAIGISDQPVIEGLTHRLKDEFATVRYEACISLGKLGRSAASALPELKGLLNDESKPVQDAAAESIRLLKQ
jgi:HEAT repeat protein